MKAYERYYYAAITPLYCLSTTGVLQQYHPWDNFKDSPLNAAITVRVRVGLKVGLRFGIGVKNNFEESPLKAYKATSIAESKLLRATSAADLEVFTAISAAEMEAAKAYSMRIHSKRLAVLRMERAPQKWRRHQLGIAINTMRINMARQLR